MQAELSWENFRPGEMLWPEVGERPHLWRARVPNPEGADLASSARRSSEHAQSARRVILAGYLRQAPETLSFTRASSGRPGLAGSPLDFNISHSGHWVLLAVARRGPVGVDVERQAPSRDLVGIAKRYFSPEEAECVEHEGPAAFYRFWTAKEAALKAAGTGISGGLDQTIPSLSQGCVSLPSGERLHLAQFFVAPDYPCSVVWAGAAGPLRDFYTLDGTTSLGYCSPRS